MTRRLRSPEEVEAKRKWDKAVEKMNAARDHEREMRQKTPPVKLVRERPTPEQVELAKAQTDYNAAITAERAAFAAWVKAQRA